MSKCVGDIYYTEDVVTLDERNRSLVESSVCDERITFPIGTHARARIVIIGFLSMAMDRCNALQER